MNSVVLDVLINIIGKLPLIQKYQLLTVNQKLQEASNNTLKQQECLAAGDHKFLARRRMCFMGQHCVKESHTINHACFNHETLDNVTNELAIKNILSRLTGLKVAIFASFDVVVCTHIMGYLAMFCPKLECLSLSSNINHKFILPTVVHFEGIFVDEKVNQLAENFPSLTGLNIQLNFVEKEHEFPKIDSAAFQEGIKTLMIQVKENRHVDLTPLYSSPAMKTIESLSLNGIRSHRNMKNINFVAPKLKKIRIVTLEEFAPTHDFSFFLDQSLSKSPELQSFSFEVKPKSIYFWMMSPKMFNSMTRLVSLSLPQALDNLHFILEVICSRNDDLENLSIGWVCGSSDKRKRILDLITSMTRLRSLTIDNSFIPQNQTVLSQAELNAFVDNNSVDGQLRFSFTLHQKQGYPGQEGTVWDYGRVVMRTVWRGIEWYQ